jgi:hypothetical protein
MTYLSKSAVLIALISPFSVANTLLDELSICAKNSDSLQRLVCYDKLAKGALDSQPHQQKVKKQVATIEPLKLEDNVEPSVQMVKKSPASPNLPPPLRAGIIKPQPTVDVANEVSQQQASFGQENKKRTTDLINQIKAQIVQIKTSAYGEQIITLSNAQVWRQTDNTRLKLRKDQVVIIKRGAMGSFFIGKENANKRMRAKRVK